MYIILAMLVSCLISWTFDLDMPMIIVVGLLCGIAGGLLEMARE